MRILLFQRDIYSCIGGGETVYQQIVEACPTIDFYYFLDKEQLENSRPSNVHPLALQQMQSLEAMEDSLFYWGLILRKEPEQNNALFFNKIHLFIQAVISRLRGMEFDIIDIPNFILVGGFIQKYLNEYCVKYKKIVTSLHGRVSSSLKMEWTPQEILNIYELETSQLCASDAAYGISERYIQEENKKSGIPFYTLDPMLFVNAFNTTYQSTHKKPAIYFIGRKSRCKGADFFLQLTRWVDISLYETAILAGPDIAVSNNQTSEYFIKQMNANRGKNVVPQKALTKEQMSIIFSKNSLLVLSSRYETLNLIALEALFSGCPVAISDQAGVCDYLDRYYPEIPYIKICTAHAYDSIKHIEFALEHYDTYREQLCTALKRVKHRPNLRAIQNMYEEILALPEKSVPINSEQNTFFYTERSRTASYKIKTSLNEHFTHLADTLAIWQRMPENSLSACDEKVHELYGLLAQSNILRLSRMRNEQEDTPLPDLPDFFNGSFFSCTLWHELARLQRICGQDQFAAMFELRAMRNLGYDHFNVLPEVCQSLRLQGFEEEAKVADLMFSPAYQTDRHSRIYAFLEERATRFMHVKEASYARVEDARYIGEPKVSIIVSLYNAASKLKQFITCLELQTMARQRQVELILQDSCSPTDEWAVIREHITSSPLSVFYGRSPTRETVQCAWNRGIKVARAPYLVLLGADEMLYPDGLEKLFDALESNPQAGWAVGDAIQTEVDANGLFVRDILKNDFTNGTTAVCMNDNKYIRWNASMYRRSLHDQFGFYDGSYNNAGCTEFGFRILPELTVTYVGQTLGEYWDYPEIRISNPFINEIAQLRACFVFRTTGGAMYIEKNKSVENIRDHLALSFKYRRCVCTHESTDITYAAALAELLRMKDPSRHNSNILKAVVELEKLLRQSLLMPEHVTGENLQSIVDFTFRRASNLTQRLENALGFKLSVGFYNDFLHERFAFIGLDRSGKENISFIT